MDVCLMIEGQEGVTWEQWVSLARACVTFGYEGLFRSDHYLAFSRPQERGALDAWATIAALGAVTERIRLGSMVSPVRSVTPQSWRSRSSRRTTHLEDVWNSVWERAGSRASTERSASRSRPRAGGWTS